MDNAKIMIALIFSLLLIAGCAAPPSSTVPPGTGPDPTEHAVTGTPSFSLKQAQGKEDVENAFLKSALSGNYYGGGFAGGIRTTSMDLGIATAEGAPAPTAPAVPGSSDGAKQTTGPSDYSQTNVQVIGIDELDNVKLDSATGKKLYVLNGQTVNFLNIFPPQDMKRYQTTETRNWANGLYEYKNSVIAISYNRIDAFSKANGDEVWHVNLNASYLDSRMKDGIIYLVMQEYPQGPYYRPMPMEVCGSGTKCMPVDIAYTSIYIPQGVSSQVFYEVISLDAETGEVIDSEAFTGPYSTTLYMSQDNIYIGMNEQISETTVTMNYLLDGGKSLIPTDIYNRLVYVNGLDISDEAKALESTVALAKWFATLTPEQSANFGNDLSDGLTAYIRADPERLEYTGIVKMSYSQHGKLSMQGTGKIPGHLLSQYSLDEYNGDLRAAVTYGRWDSAENGVVVLGSDMKKKGMIVGMAEGERIYAVRFMGPTGYVVTYRQTDPLFVMDLSDPANPKIAGELKVPGFSTYLHPIGDGKLVGIGQDGSKMKLSLFDISNPADPKELDTYKLDAYWSEALYNPHAFVYHPGKQLVILPIGGQDYVFSVTGNSIALKKILDEQAQRNVYADEYLYVVTSTDVAAFSFADYSEISREDLKGGYDYRYYGSGDVITEQLPPVPTTAPAASGGSSGAGSSGSAGAATPSS